MATKTLQSRIIAKHDTEDHWNLAQNFIPKLGEIIIYDIDDNHEYERIKIGDGVTKVANLPFNNETMTETELDTMWNTVFGS